MAADLQKHIDEHESFGCVQRFLGAVKMPPGYALMLNADYSHYYFLHESGRQSVIHWNKWAIYQWAKAEADKLLTELEVQPSAASSEAVATKAKPSIEGRDGTDGS